MKKPKRIQLRRVKGWRKPANCVVVSRPSRFGNPFTVAKAREAGFAGDEGGLRRVCVIAFQGWLRSDPMQWQGSECDARRAKLLEGLESLRGKDLACWCPLDQPCHADVLLEVANR